MLLTTQYKNNSIDRNHYCSYYHNTALYTFFFLYLGVYLIFTEVCMCRDDIFATLVPIIFVIHIFAMNETNLV